MLLNYFCLISFVCLMLSKANASTNSTLENDKEMKEIMLADIESAFRSITNFSHVMLHDKIIPEMYNLTRSHTFVFKVPDMKSALGYAMITTDRSELMQPIFPNLTLNSEQVMLKNRRLQSAVRNSEGSHNVKVSSAEVWSNLGLDGWSGELTIATDSLEYTHKDQKDNKPQKDWSTNVSIHTENQASHKATPHETAVNLETTEMVPVNTSLTDLSDNIYIARANDPFGLSTKWSYRNQSIEENRQKRDIVELYSMLKCATGCEPLLYQSYGCFCGFSGRGVAVDGIDRCCRMHDKCYEHSNCFPYLHYFVPYVWKCYHGKPLCALDHGEYGGPTSCAALLCYCDMKFSICLRKFHCPLTKAVCNTSLARKLQNIFL